MHITRTYIRLVNFIEMVNHYYIVEEDEEGLQPFLDLFKLLSNSEVLRHVIYVINRYQGFFTEDSEQDVMDWEEAILSEYGHEIYTYSRKGEIDEIISTTHLLDFTHVFMELVYDQGIDEIYNSPVNAIEVKRNGRVSITFD